MILTTDITKAIVAAFTDDPAFNAWTIGRSEYVNEDHAMTPWLGVYRQEMDYSPETLGEGPDYWTAVITVRLIVQAANLAGGEQCEDDLEGYVKDVLTKILADTTLSNTIDMVNDIKISYSYIAEDEETVYFQAALITLTLEVSTS
jgi:hypothetical protein